MDYGLHIILFNSNFISSSAMILKYTIGTRCHGVEVPNQSFPDG
jgi:hypothetical protein